MRKPTRALLGVLIACVSLSACATLHLPTAHLERARVTPAGVRVGAAFGHETSRNTLFNADAGGWVPRSERHARVLRYGGAFGATLSAPMLPVDCVAATSTPCVATGNPGNGSEGDPAWLAFGKVNAWGTQLGLFANDPANEVLATPDGAAGIPYLRALVGNDIPPINLATTVNGGVTGTLGPLNGGTGLSAYAVGDILYASAANTLSPLVPGANGTVLAISGGLPTWTSGIVSAGTPAALYDTAVFESGTGIIGVTPGTAGQALTSAGASAYPAYSSTLSDVTSVNGSTIPATAGILAGSTGTFVLSDCLEVGSTSPLEIKDAGAVCGSGGGSSAFNAITSGTNQELPAPTGLAATVNTATSTLPASQEYAFEVVAVNANGTTTPSSVVTATTGSTADDSTISLTWTAVSGATSYEVWYAAGATVPSSADYYTSTNASYTFSAASGTAGTAPTVNTTGADMTVGNGAVVTYSGTGSVNASEVAGVIKAVNTAAAGNTLTPNCDYAMVKVTGTTYLIPAPTETAPSTADTGGTLAGGVYDYVVTASTAVGQTTISTQQSIPSITIAAPTNGAITASAAPLGAATYEVQSTWVNADGETTGSTATSYATTNLAAPTAGTATTATTGGTGLAASTTYYMVVTATNANGQTTISSVESVATGTGTTNTVTANWTDVTGATGYDVYLSTATITAGEASVAYSTAASTATSLTFTAVPSTTATTPSSNTTAGGITVAAPASPPSSATGWNAYVCSGASCTNETLQNTTPIGTTTAWVEPTTGLTTTGAVTPTTNTAYATNTNENTVNWNAVTGATGYTVYRSTTSGNFTNSTSYAVSGGSTITFLDTGATGTTATPPTTNTTGLFTINTPGTCTPVDGQQLEIKIISPAGGLLTYSWGSGYQASGQLAFPTTSYAAGDEDFFTVQYDADLTKWDLMATNQGF